MNVNDLYESLKRLIDEGKGHYLVAIECLDGYTERSDTIHIDDKHEDVSIVGC